MPFSPSSFPAPPTPVFPSQGRDMSEAIIPASFAVESRVTYLNQERPAEISFRPTFQWEHSFNRETQQLTADAVFNYYLSVGFIYDRQFLFSLSSDAGEFSSGYVLIVVHAKNPQNFVKTETGKLSDWDASLVFVPFDIRTQPAADLKGAIEEVLDEFIESLHSVKLVYNTLSLGYFHNPSEADFIANPDTPVFDYYFVGGDLDFEVVHAVVRNVKTKLIDFYAKHLNWFDNESMTERLWERYDLPFAISWMTDEDVLKWIINDFGGEDAGAFVDVPEIIREYEKLEMQAAGKLSGGLTLGAEGSPAASVPLSLSVVFPPLSGTISGAYGNIEGALSGDLGECELEPPEISFYGVNYATVAFPSYFEGDGKIDVGQNVGNTGHSWAKTTWPWGQTLPSATNFSINRHWEGNALEVNVDVLDYQKPIVVSPPYVGFSWASDFTFEGELFPDNMLIENPERTLNFADGGLLAVASLVAEPVFDAEETSLSGYATLEPSRFYNDYTEFNLEAFSKIGLFIFHAEDTVF
jgi:hypothetical protein